MQKRATWRASSSIAFIYKRVRTCLYIESVIEISRYLRTRREKSIPESRTKFPEKVSRETSVLQSAHIWLNYFSNTAYHWRPSKRLLENRGPSLTKVSAFRKKQNKAEKSNKLSTPKNEMGSQSAEIDERARRRRANDWKWNEPSLSLKPLIQALARPKSERLMKYVLISNR